MIIQNFSGKIRTILGNNDAEIITFTKMTLDNSNNFEMDLDNKGMFADFEIDGIKICITHYPKLGTLLAKSDEFDFVFYGHTHIAKTELINNTKLINPGSIIPENKIVSFAILDTQTKEVETITF